MASISHFQSIFRFLICFILVACTAQVVCADERITRASNSVALSVLYLLPGEPLQAGTGMSIRYSHAFFSKLTVTRVKSTGVVTPQRSLLLEGSFTGTNLNRQPQGTAKEGAVSLHFFSINLRESWNFNEGKWKLELGGGLDYITADGKGHYSTSAPIGISNHYDVDSGIGYRAGLVAVRSLTFHLGLLLGLEYQFADLDGEQSFVISGVSGIPMPVKFDLTGPRTELGLVYRF